MIFIRDYLIIVFFRLTINCIPFKKGVGNMGDCEGKEIHYEQKEMGKKWRKILYERQPFDDEYGGGSEFLKELKTNSKFLLEIFPILL